MPNQREFSIRIWFNSLVKSTLFEELVNKERLSDSEL
jgi:hypothetical protein